MRAAIFGTLCLAIFATVASAQDVIYDFDKSANFATYKTYARIPGTELGDELNHKRIVAAVETQLKAKGLTRTDASGNPDVLVAYHASIDVDRRLTASGFGGHPLGGPRSGSARVEDVFIGTLAIDLVDAHTRTLVWRSMARKELDVEAKPEKREKNLARATDKLLKNYPPSER
jgi:hypothetical protein